MKILRVEKLKRKKSNEKTPAASQTNGELTPEDSKESESVEEKTGAESADVPSF